MLEQVEQARREVIEGLFGQPGRLGHENTFRRMWDSGWRNAISGALGSTPGPDDLIRLGSKLSDLFLTMRGDGGRAQSILAGAGVAWESLVAWYLNLCLLGSTAWVTKKRSSIPGPVRDALSISYRGVDSNSESDLVAVTFDEAIPQGADPEAPLEHLVQKYFSQLVVVVIQCKTNWNDNSQIPMLWSLVYDILREASVVGITMGRNGRRLQRFSYAFVTIPTNDPSRITPQSIIARRVQNLSGGNYWGRPTKQGVAKSLYEIFNSGPIGPRGGSQVNQSFEAYAGAHGIPDYFRLR